MDSIEKTGMLIDVAPKRASSAKDPVDPGAKGAVDAKEMREACRQFEEIFLRILLKEARIDRSLGSGEDATSKMYGDMTREAMAWALAQAGGFGLAEVLYRQLSMDEKEAGRAESHPIKEFISKNLYKAEEHNSDL